MCMVVAYFEQCYKILPFCVSYIHSHHPTPNLVSNILAAVAMGTKMLCIDFPATYMLGTAYIYQQGTEYKKRQYPFIDPGLTETGEVADNLCNIVDVQHVQD